MRMTTLLIDDEEEEEQGAGVNDNGEHHRSELDAVESSLIFSTFQNGSKIKMYAPLYVCVTSRDPEPERLSDPSGELAGRLSADAQEAVQFGNKKVNVSVNVQEKAYVTKSTPDGIRAQEYIDHGTLGINVDGPLIKLFLSLTDWHVDLLKINDLLQHDADVVYLAGKFGIAMYVDFISGTLDLPYVDVKMPFSIVVKLSELFVKSARGVVIASQEDPIYVIVKDGMVGVQMPGASPHPLQNS